MQPGWEGKHSIAEQYYPASAHLFTPGESNPSTGRLFGRWEETRADRKKCANWENMHKKKKRKKKCFLFCFLKKLYCLFAASDDHELPHPSMPGSQNWPCSLGERHRILSPLSIAVVIDNRGCLWAPRLVLQLLCDRGGMAAGRELMSDQIGEKIGENKKSLLLCPGNISQLDQESLFSLKYHF